MSINIPAPSKVTVVLLSAITFLTLWIVVAECSRPTPVDPLRIAAEERAEMFKAQLDSAVKAGKAIAKVAEERRVKDSVERRALKLKSEGWERKYREVKPVVVMMADTNEILKQFLALDDSLHAAKGEEIAQLERVNIAQAKVIDELVINQDAINRAHTMLTSQKDAIIAEQDRTIKRQNKKIRFLKVMVPVVIAKAVILLIIL